MKRRRFVLTTCVVLWLLFTPWFGTLGEVYLLREGQTEFFGVTDVTRAHWDTETHRLRACLKGAWREESGTREVHFDAVIPYDAEAEAKISQRVNFNPIGNYRRIRAGVKPGCDLSETEDNIHRGHYQSDSSLLLLPDGITNAIYATEAPQGSYGLRLFISQEGAIVEWKVDLYPRQLMLTRFEKFRRVAMAFALDALIGPLIWVSVFFSGGH